MDIGSIVQLRIKNRHTLSDSAVAYDKYTHTAIKLKALPDTTLYILVAVYSAVCQLKPLVQNLAIAGYPPDAQYLNDDLYVTSNVEIAAVVQAPLSVFVSKGPTNGI